MYVYLYVTRGTHPPENASREEHSREGREACGCFEHWHTADGREGDELQGFLAHKKQPLPVGSPRCRGWGLPAMCLASHGNTRLVPGSTNPMKGNTEGDIG